MLCCAVLTTDQTTTPASGSAWLRAGQFNLAIHAAIFIALIAADGQPFHPAILPKATNSATLQVPDNTDPFPRSVYCTIVIYCLGPWLLNLSKYNPDVCYS